MVVQFAHLAKLGKSHMGKDGIINFNQKPRPKILLGEYLRLCVMLPTTGQDGIRFLTLDLHRSPFQPKNFERGKN